MGNLSSKLLDCVYRNDLKTMKQIVETKIEKVENATIFDDKNGKTLLYLACNRGNIEMVEYMLEYGLQINQIEADPNLTVFAVFHEKIQSNIYKKKQKKSSLLQTKTELTSTEKIGILKILLKFEELNFNVRNEDGLLPITFVENKDQLVFLLENKANPDLTYSSLKCSIAHVFFFIFFFFFFF